MEVIKTQRREILRRVVEAFFRDDFSSLGDVSDFIAALFGEDVAALGHGDEKKTETVPTVLTRSCHRCRGGEFVATNLCQNCAKKPCAAACRFEAIRRKEDGVTIDASTCKRCGACQRACPYGAIVKTVMPCAAACPVAAIKNDENGRASIAADRCIHCGKCLTICPFEAIQPPSHLLSVLRAMRDGREVIALLAPAFFSQFPLTVGQARVALGKIGFADGIEVARGAEVTTLTEAEEVDERLARGDGFVTSSCCAAYNNLVERHIPELKPFVSTTKTPLYYTAKQVRQERPEAILVFLSPCLAKYGEVVGSEDVNYAISLEEVDVLFAVRGVVELSTCEEGSSPKKTAMEARDFARSGGVALAIETAKRGNGAKFVAINGLTKDSVDELRTWAKSASCPRGNMVEVMACPGGCMGGTFTFCPLTAAQRQLKTYASQGDSIKERENENKKSC